MCFYLSFRISVYMCVRVRLCVCVCVCVRARLCVCVCVGLFFLSFYLSFFLSLPSPSNNLITCTAER